MATETQLLSPSLGRPGVRRLSSITATVDELSIGPSIVVPPKNLARPGDAHETAESLELAKQHLKSISAGIPIESVLSTPPETSVTDKYAFAFDIDGVLIRGGKPIPQAIEAMKMLNGENEHGVKV